MSSPSPQSSYQPRVLLLSGPVEPPWTRSDKNLVRGVATHMSRYRPRVLTHEGVVGALPAHVETDPAWGPRVGGHTPVGRRLGLFNRLLGDTSADLVHLFWPADVLVCPAVRAACRMRSLPLLHTLVRAPRTTLGITRLVAAEPVVCLSQETQRRIQREGVDDALWIPPGIHMRTVTTDRATIRARCGIPSHLPVVLYAGDYTHTYAARTVAATLPRVVRELPVHFVMACRLRSRKDADEEAKIRSALLADGMGHHITFLNEVDDISELLAASDIQIFPADSANQRLDMPMVLLEGLAQGISTIVANKPPFEELVEPGAAIGVPSMNPVSIAVAIVELLRDPERRQRLGERAKQLVKDRFDIAAVTTAYEALYDRVLTDHRGTSRRRRGAISGGFAAVSSVRAMRPEVKK
ncbi:MAG: glycosyltransferase [Myxococcales bacterium]|nr:glycosyltransferase [Myxococcales bacterium]